MRGLRRAAFFRKPKVFIPAVVLLLLIAAAVMAARNLNAPAEGTVTTQLNQNPAVSDSADTTPKTYQDGFMSFKYPASYTMQPTTTDKSSLDSLKLVDSRFRDKYASLDLAKDSLAGDSGVSYRRGHPELYKTVTDSPQAAVFSKIDGTEYTGFIAHGDEVLSISLTSVSATDLSADYNLIAGSLQWPK